MEIERMKKLLKSGIEAGNKVKAVRKVMEAYVNQKQDQYDDTAEILAPTIDAQKSMKKTIDEKQDEVIEQLQKNQKALTEGLEANQRMFLFDRELPQAIEAGPSVGTADDVPTILDIDNNFNKDDRSILNTYGFLPPKNLTQVGPERLNQERDKTVVVNRMIGNRKKTKDKTEADLLYWKREMNTIKKYRSTIDDVLRSMKYRPQTGKGHFFYNNPQELLSRLELLGGSMSAGNNSETVREEFANIVHKLNKLNMIDNKQMNNLIREYLF